MNKENSKIAYVVGGVIIGILLILLLEPKIQSNGMMSWGTSRGIDSARSIKGNSIDQHFIEQMIPHHEGAIDMAKLALTKATHPEIKILAREIIEAQNKEIVDMQAWYKNWFGKNALEGRYEMRGGGMMFGGGMHMGGAEDMKALESATEFDKVFIEAMIPHHQLAIMMAEMLQSGTNRSDMQQLATAIIQSQSVEIEKMQNWYTGWYK